MATRPIRGACLGHDEDTVAAGLHNDEVVNAEVAAGLRNDEVVNAKVAAGLHSGSTDEVVKVKAVIATMTRMVRFPDNVTEVRPQTGRRDENYRALSKRPKTESSESKRRCTLYYMFYLFV